MKRLFPLLTFLAVALISMVMAGFAYFATQEATRIKFEATVDDAISRIDTRLDLHLTMLRATQAFFDAHGNHVSRNEFQAFISALDVGVNFPGLRGIGFLQLVRKGDEELAERAIRQEQGLDRKVYPESTQQWRTPILMFEPLKPSSDSVIGFDMFSEPARREAIEAAMKDDAHHATGPVMLGGNSGVEPYPGFIVFARLKQDASPGTVATSTPVTQGFLYAAFRANELFQLALRRIPLLPVHVEIYDGEVEPQRLMFSSATPAATTLGGIVDTRRMNVAGRQWILQFQPTSAFSPPSSRVIPVMLGLFGLLLAGAIALVARYKERAYHAAEQLHETAEKSLLEKDLMLQEMKHRIKNLITRILAIARQTASRATDVKEFSDSFAARLQAMAASQDMLTRSRWQKADLSELLRIELGQVFGKDLPDGLLSGPQVLLDETATQALGLTFHELATNALKYGEAGHSVDALKVEWRMERLDRKRMLVLNWRESGQEGLAEPASTGFGTKLIDMNITRELNGSIERRFLPSGLQVEIRIPLK
ncbi:CHASE domain-containing protein [Aquamicrobium terrae]